MAYFKKLLPLLVLCMVTGSSTAHYCRVNGIHEEYRIEDQICCAGKLTDKTSLYTTCCRTADRPFDSSKEVCCGNKVELLPKGVQPGDRGCCNSKIYNTREQQCCMGHLYDTHIDRGNGLFTKRDGFCCGKQFIDVSDRTLRKACCIKNGDLNAGGTPYSQNDEVCCDGHVIKVLDGKRQCCGSSVYNPRNEVCCLTANDRYEPLPTVGYGQNVCCKNAPGGVVDLGTHVCVADEPEERQCYRNDPVDRNVGCCEYLRFNRNVSSCCGGELINLNETCCGRERLLEGRLCCGFSESVFPDKPGDNACCLGTASNYQTYNDQLAVCVHRRVRPIKWCGSKRYRPNKKVCCNGKLHKRYSNHYACCGQAIYNIKHMNCCDEKISAVSATCHL